MTLQELIDELRERVGDETIPPLVSDARLTKYANEAEREACRRARLIVDATTAACCQITLEEGTATYDLHAKVLFVRSARVDGDNATFLQRLHAKDLNKGGPEWLSEAGETVGWVLGMDTQKFRPYRIPGAAEDGNVVHLTVVREPLQDMADAEADSPEIHGRWHMGLVDWMEYRYYSTRDEQIKDDKLAAEALARFELQFGPAPSAAEEAWAQEQQAFLEDDGNVYGG